MRPPSRVLLRAMIRLLPAPFRARFGAEIAEQIERDWRSARSRGRWAAASFTVATAADLVGTAVKERLAPSIPRRIGGRRGTGPTTRMTTTGGDGTMNPLNDLIHDVRLGARALARAPGFTATAAGTLAVALGAAAATFALVDGILLRPLPFPDADRLVAIKGSAPGSDMEGEFGLGPEFALQYREEVERLEDVGLYDSFTNTLRTPDRVERVRMAMVTPSLFSTLGVEAELGRLPRPEEDGRTIVISHGLWTAWFGRDPEVLGRSYEAGGETRTVVGVMPADFDFPSDEGEVTLWIARPVTAEGLRPGTWSMSVVARVAPDTDLEALRTRLATAASRLPERFGGSAAYAEIIRRHRPVVRPLRDEILGSVSGPLWILFGAVGVVLVIATANVANLFLVRAEGRLRDAAVRRALGAGRGRLVRHQLMETLLVALLAGGAAVALALVALPALRAGIPGQVPRIDAADLSGATLLFTFVASVLAGLACGVVPAIRLARAGTDRLRDGMRGSTRRRPWARDGLVVAQTGLALVLVTASALLLRSFVELRSVDPGYDTRDIFTFQFAPEQDGLDDGPSFARFHLAFMERLRALPGVEAVGIVENVPIDEGYAMARAVSEAAVASAGSGEARSHPLGITATGGDYFEAMGIEILRGRGFTEAEHLENPGHVVVSRSVAETFWPGEDPIGKRIRTTGRDDWETVIGVVEDVRQYDFRVAGEPLMYYPLVSQNPEDWALGSPGYVVRTPRADGIAAEVRALVGEVAPEAPVYRTWTLEQLAAGSMAELTFTLLAVGMAAGLSLLLGMVGLYGVLSSTVAERTREIGVRMALGAQAERVRRMVVGQGVRVVAVGVALGLAAAVIALGALEGLLFGVPALHLPTLGLTALLMLAVGAAASWFPARRASAVDPARSLAQG